MHPGGKARDNAPTPREYRDLRRAVQNRVEASRGDDYEHRLECEFVLRMMGELGMRAGEIAHMKEDWVDFDRLQIEIPEFQQCEKGKDGGPCGYCKKQAKQSVKKTDVSYEKALRRCWSPKNEMAARTIPFGWDDELVDLIDEYMYKHGGFPKARVAINRRVDDMTEESDRVDKEDVFPHALRAHAAIYHAKKGMRAYHLTEFMGWADVSGAMPYIKMAADDLQTEMKRVHQYQ